MSLHALVRQTRILWRLSVLAAFVLCLAPHSAPRAAVDAEAYTAVNLALAEGHILPRYRELSRATAALDRAASAFCGAGAEQPIEPLREHYHRTMDAWMGVQHIRSGPVELFMRNFRLQFWPDRKNSVGKELARLSKAEDLEARLGDDFARRSVAIQGFPALERLLYSESFFGGGDNGHRPKSCRILSAITANLSSIASDLVEEWQGALSPPADRLRGAEGTQAYLAGLHTMLQMIGDMKLGFPLGKSLKKAKPRRSESWRSARNLRNVRLNLAALQALYLGEGGDGLRVLLPDSNAGRALDQDMQAQLSNAMGRVAAVGMPLAEAVSDPAARAQVEALRSALSELRTAVAGPFAAAIGLQLGFNELDGD